MTVEKQFPAEILNPPIVYSLDEALEKGQKAIITQWELLFLNFYHIAKDSPLFQQNHL